MKYSKEVISFCIEVLKNERGCIPLRFTCDKCLIRNRCYLRSHEGTIVDSKTTAKEIIKEILGNEI